jgi:hypothetical protein
MPLLNAFSTRIAFLTCLLVVLACLVSAGSASAATTTVNCNKVQKNSSTTADSSHSIQYTVGDQTCDFTIDGAKASSSTLPTEMGNALHELATQEAQNLDDKGLLALLGQYIGIPPNQMDGLQNSLNDQDLRDCAKLFDANNLPDNASTNFVVQKDQLTCGVVRPSNEMVRIPNESFVGFTSDQVMVVVSVHTNNITFGRLAPRSLVQFALDATNAQRI